MPRIRILGTTKISNESGVKAVGLITFQLAGSIGCNSTWIDHAHGQTLLVKKLGQFISITACCFHANVGVAPTMFLQPFAQFFVPNLIVACLERCRAIFLCKERIKSVF